MNIFTKKEIELLLHALTIYYNDCTLETEYDVDVV